jgi:signal peptidase I
MASERAQAKAVRVPQGRPAVEPAPFKKSTLREYFESIVIAVILALFIRTFVVQAFKIPTGSMENNLLIGDHLLVNKFVFGASETGLERTLLPIGTIKRGDVVVFKYPEEPERDFIKRVIGLPGETLELREKKVYVNGQPLDEPYVHFLTPASSASQLHEMTTFDVRERYGPVTVPPDHYFVMGDNRDNSQDSRYWGFLPRQNVKGRALLIYWSYDAGPGEYVETDTGTSIRNTASVFVHFFTRTRWSRMFRPIH